MLGKIKTRQNKDRLRLDQEYKNRDGYVFVNPDGSRQHPDSVTSWFPEFMVKVGLPRLRFHDLRHTHASLVLNAGESLKVVSELLGHANIGITADIYTHLMPGAKKAGDRKAGKGNHNELRRLKVAAQLLPKYPL